MLRLFTEILESSLELDQCCTQHCIIYCRAMQCISAAYAVMRCLCLSVCVSVTFVSCVTHSLTAALDQLRVVASSTSNDPGPRSRQHQQSCVKTNKDIFEIFSPSGSHTILFFRT